MQHEPRYPVLGANEPRQGDCCALPWKTSKTSAACLPQLEQVVQERYCHYYQILSVFGCARIRNRYLQQKLHLWFKRCQVDRTRVCDVCFILVLVHTNQFTDSARTNLDYFQCLGASKELLRTPLIWDLSLSDTCSGGPVYSSQEALSLLDLIEWSEIVYLYFQYQHHIHYQNRHHHNLSHSVAYKTAAIAIHHINEFIGDRTLRIQRNQKFHFRVVEEEKNEIGPGLLGSNAGSSYVAAAARWPATRNQQAKRDLFRVLALALMRFDDYSATNRATESSILRAPVSKRRLELSLSSLQPLSLPQLPSAPSPISAATSASTSTTRRSQNQNDAALKCSITASNKNSLFSGDRTPAAHSTAFQKSRHVQRNSQPILFMFYLLALLLEMSGCHWAVVGAEGTSSSGTKSIDNSQHGAVEEQHPYNEYTWELNQLNPWLSACDLAGPAPADLQGSCGPPEVPKNCPISCTTMHGRRKDNLSLFDDIINSLGYIRNVTVVHWETQPKESTNAGTERTTIAPEQCLFYLEESHKRDICRKNFGQASSWSFMNPRENRYWFMSGLRLKHCCEHAAVNALAPGKGGPFEAVLNGGESCVKAIDKLLLVDTLAARLHCEFEEVLARYDCSQSYSVIHNCTHCKEAYRKWICSSLVPYFAHEGPLNLEPSEASWAGRRLRPCRSFCQSVEQRCPYLLPGDRAPAYPTQYAGEPTFLCQDPNIPETGEQASKALHPNTEEECCFKICSEEKPALGICANCTGCLLNMGPKYHNPPIAPQCEVITFPTGQQQVQPSRHLSLCGNGGIGSMNTNENPFFINPLISSVFSESSSELSESIVTSTVNTISSSAVSVTSSPVSILCLFWIWSVFFYSQYSERRLFGVICLTEQHLRKLCTSYIRNIQPFLIDLLSILSYCSQDRQFDHPSRIRGCYHLIMSLSTMLMFTTVLISVMNNNIVIVKRYLCKKNKFHCCYCYRWWLWPDRWKSYCLLPSSNYEKFCCTRLHCSHWYYWRYLWPYRWKRNEFISFLNKGRSCSILIFFREQKKSLNTRKKRRWKIRFCTSCCHKLNLVQSTPWCRLSS